MIRKFHIYALAAALSLIAAGCRTDEVVVPAEYETVPQVPDPDSKVRGLYLVNEGNMGSNKCSLDYLDFATSRYVRNFYAERNPDVIKELGDVGNDIAVYGSKLYVVVNCSHKVEVLDAHTGIRIGQVDIPNCRYVRFHGGNAYVSSYVGPVSIDPDAPKGAVYEVDTASLTINRHVTVGYQPEEMEILDGYMYVANSGGYRAPDYDNTLSVIDMESFQQVDRIPVAPNLHRVRKDRYGRLWVTSRGDYAENPSRLIVMSRPAANDRMQVEEVIPTPCSNLAIHGDLLYYIAADRDGGSGSNTVRYGVVDVRTHKIITDNFITDGTEKRITMPYGLAVHPETGDIYLTDAKNYVSSGLLYCFSPEGKLRWSIRTGDIPASMTFLIHNP